MSKEVFLEIGTEEIPAIFLSPALAQLELIAENIFQKNRIAFSHLKVMGTPRRLVLWGCGVSDRQTDFEQETIGPPKRIAYNAKGKPSPAALGFAKAQGVSEKEIYFKNTGKGEYLCVKKHEKGKLTFALLKTLLPEIITSIHFPKTMRWQAEGLRFARPIRWMVALFDGRVVPFSLAGVRSGDFSCGHRAYRLKGSEELVRFQVKNFRQYIKKARQLHVMVDPLERKNKIQEEIYQLTRKRKGGIVPDEALLDLTANMLEFPVALKGEFEREYLDLPRGVLISSMREHQGYFPIEDKNAKILPQFISICDVKGAKMDVIRKGHERVLRARLADAKFFFQKDLKEGLDKRVDELKGMVFQEGLGSLYEKTERLMAFGLFFVNQWNGVDKDLVQRAAFLCKADLRTEMVGEFPKLQGSMGAEYASLQGEDPQVSRAIAEQYLPGFVGDQLPQTDLGIILSIADKLDTLTGFFGLNCVPTGSQDPYGLRRQALGIVQVLLGREIRLSLASSITEALGLYQGRLKRAPQELGEDLLDFLNQRVLYLLAQKGYRNDFVTAILVRCDDPFDAQERVIALTDLSRKAGFNELVVAFKRVMNILPKTFEGKIQTALFQSDGERDLFREYERTCKNILPLVKDFHYAGILQEMVSLKPFIDVFFDQVLVMDPDPKICQNRLALLKGLRDLFWEFADFSQIQESEGIAG